MSEVYSEIISICHEISMEKLRIEAAISKGDIFEEVKKKVLSLRALEQKLDDCVTREIQQVNNDR